MVEAAFKNRGLSFLEALSRNPFPPPRTMNLEADTDIAGRSVSGAVAGQFSPSPPLLST